jgi:hypothetical protein
VDTLKNKDMAILGIGGLAIWYLLKNNSGSDGQFVLGDGGGGSGQGADVTAAGTNVNAGTGGTGGGTVIDTGIGTNPPVLSYNPRPSRSNDYLKSIIGTPPPGGVFGGVASFKPKTNEIHTPVGDMPLVGRIAVGMTTGGVSEVVRMGQEMSAENRRLPWWAGIFAPITYPVALAVTTHQPTPTPNLWQRMADPTTPAPTARAAATAPSLSGRATAFNSMAAQFGVNRDLFSELPQRIQGRINAGTIPERVQVSMAGYAGVRNLTYSAYDYGGGAAAFPQGRAAIESAQVSYQGSPTTIARREMVQANRNRAPGTPANVLVWQNGHYVQKTRGY